MTRVTPAGRRRGRFLIPAATLAAASLALSAATASGQTLKGSSASLDRQNEAARQHDFSFLSTPAQVRTFVSQGYLVPVRPNSELELHDVSFPFARSEVADFIDRLAAEFKQICGQKLVVTSLTRPLSNQPRNASVRSVHPTGMAVDFRLPPAGRCRSWFESTLLQLDGAGVLDATREANPPHYHVVVFPNQYSSYVATGEASVSATSVASTAMAANPQSPAEITRYQVRSGDSLWTIAQKLGTTVERLKNENALRSSKIYAGQVITVTGR
jgi:LysM repeat protein